MEAIKLVIWKVDAFPSRIPVRRGKTADAAAWGDKELPAAASPLVRVTTDEGLRGWGESFDCKAVPSAKLALEELIAPIALAETRGAAQDRRHPDRGGRRRVGSNGLPSALDRWIGELCPTEPRQDGRYQRSDQSYPARLSS
jgi:L-alanine-DL-glutamate epimerase-like enolase superfamily enzyme